MDRLLLGDGVSTDRCNGQGFELNLETLSKINTKNYPLLSQLIQ